MKTVAVPVESETTINDNPDFETLLPPLDSIEFWKTILPTNPDAPLIDKEVLAWAVHQFASKNQLVEAEKVFGIIKLRYELNGRSDYRITKRICDKQGFIDSANVAEDVVQEVWLQIWQTLAGPNKSKYDLSAYQRNFNSKFIDRLSDKAKTIRNHEKRAGSQQVPNYVNVSLNQAFSTELDSQDEKLEVGGTVADYQTLIEIDLSDLWFELYKRLEPAEIEVLKMFRQVDKPSVNKVARQLHLAEKTVSRIKDKIKTLIQELSST